MAPAPEMPNKADWGKAVCSVLVHRDVSSPKAITLGRVQQEKKMGA